MTIGEFSGVTGISGYTLRYYEKKGLRLKDTGMLLRDIKRYSDLRYQGDETMEERMELLVSHRRFVIEEQKKWAEYLENLDEKIGIYRQRLKTGKTLSYTQGRKISVPQYLKSRK